MQQCIRDHFFNHRAELLLPCATAAAATAALTAQRLEPRLHVRVHRLLRALLLLVRLLLGGPRRVRVGPPDGAAVDAIARDAGDAARRDGGHDLSAPLGQRHPADRGGPEVGRALLDRRHRAEDLIAGLAPLGDERRVDDLLAHEKVVQVARDLLLLVVQVVDVPVALPMQAVNRPVRLGLALAVVRVVDRLAHAVLELEESRLDQRPALGLPLGREPHPEAHGQVPRTNE
mmetsp:Transcript_45822/g.144091  ORF Transcript_45822/g.144091 Transcript_45822/m.144091 type:complete len:231 (-) Transcript_45822:6-698(-)